MHIGIVYIIIFDSWSTKQMEYICPVCLQNEHRENRLRKDYEDATVGQLFSTKIGI